MSASPWLPIALIGLGLALRLRLFLANVGLKIGEAELALNLVHRDYAGLLQPLDDDQGAPIGFLWLVKATIETFGNDERALRAVALVAALASLPLFWALARRVLPRPAALFGLGLFAIAPKLIAHAAEVKQYSSDVAFALAMMLAGLAGLDLADRAGTTVRRWIGLALLGVIAPWCSHASVLVFAGVGSVLGAVAVARRNRRGVVVLAGVALASAASLAALWWISLRQLGRNEFLLRYWDRGFMPLPPRSLADLRWFPEMCIRTFEEPGYFVPAAFAALAFVIGAIACWRDHRPRAGIVLAPVAVTLLASGFHQYPFMDRLISFLVPSLLIGVAAGLEALRRALAPRERWIWWIFAGWLVFDQASSQALRFFVPKRFEDAREIVARLAQEWRAGDAIYLYCDSFVPFRYYAPRNGFAPPEVKVGRSSDGRFDDAMADLRELPRQRRVWLMFSHVHDAEGPANEERFMLMLLERAGGRELARFEEVGASLHLYDLERVVDGAF